MKKLKDYLEPDLIVCSFDIGNLILMSATFAVEGDYDPDAEWLG